MHSRIQTYRRSSCTGVAQSGFTLIEALVATSITAIAGSALLLGLSNSLNTTSMTIEQTIAAGMAQQLMDEIAARRYASVPDVAYESTLGPSSYETAGEGRERFTDIDDYNGYVAKPAVDLWGKKLGTENGLGGTRHTSFQTANYFDRWQQEVSVYYVSNSDLTSRLPGGQSSNYRAVEIRISFDDPVRGLRLITTLRRVFAYVPAS